MEFIILTLSNFVIATGMVLLVYYKWFKSDEKKDAEIEFWESQYWEIKEKNNVDSFKLIQKLDEIETIKKESLTLQSGIDYFESKAEHLIGKCKKIAFKYVELEMKIRDYQYKLSRFNRNRDKKTGLYIKS